MKPPRAQSPSCKLSGSKESIQQSFSKRSTRFKAGGARASARAMAWAAPAVALAAGAVAPTSAVLAAVWAGSSDQVVSVAAGVAHFLASRAAGVAVEAWDRAEGGAVANAPEEAAIGRLPSEGPIFSNTGSRMTLSRLSSTIRSKTHRRTAHPLPAILS